MSRARNNGTYFVSSNCSEMKMRNDLTPMVLKRRCLFVMTCLIVSFNTFSQSNERALEYLVALREPTFEISTHFLAYTKLVLLEGLTKKSIRNKADMLKEVQEARIKIREIPNVNGQDQLMEVYQNYFTAMETYLNRLPTIEIESVEYFDPDSAIKFQKAHIDQLDILFKGAATLKSGFERFSLLNHVVGVKTSGGLTPKQSEAVNLISYAVQVSNAVMNVRRLNRLYFISLREDTGNKAEEVRQKLLAESVLAKARLQAIPNFPGDVTLKRAALNNVRLYGIAASRLYIRLLAFRKEELAFIRKSEEFKVNRTNSEFDTDAYYKEVRRFSALIGLNRKEIKSLNQTRLDLERTFDDTFLSFVENRFVL